MRPDRSSVESRGEFSQFEPEEPADEDMRSSTMSTGNLSQVEAKYSCASCGSGGAIILAWGVLSNELRDDLSVMASRLVWLLLLMLILASSAYLTNVIEGNMGIMQPARNGSPWTPARFQCAGLGILNAIAVLAGIIANEARDTLAPGDIRVLWVIFGMLWLLSTANFLTVMLTARAGPELESGREIMTSNPAGRVAAPSPQRRGPPPSPHGPPRQSVEGLTDLSRESLSRDSVEGPPPPMRPIPSGGLSSVREERLSQTGGSPLGTPVHRRSCSQETFVA